MHEEAVIFPTVQHDRDVDYQWFITRYIENMSHSGANYVTRFYNLTYKQISISILLILKLLTNHVFASIHYICTKHHKTTDSFFKYTTGA